MAEREPGQRQTDDTERLAPRRDCAAQPATPTRKAKLPPSTQTSVASHHSAPGGAATQPAASDAPHRASTSTPIRTAPEPFLPFKRPHSQPAAPMKASVSNANGHGVGANIAGSSSASRTRAVTTRCLSIASVERRAVPSRLSAPWGQRTQ